jgi:hypothetical protein
LEQRALLAADPGWAFSLPGPAFDAATHVNVGPDGFLYASGGFSGTVDFDPGPGVVQYTARTDANDNFIAKYTPQGALVWARQFGGARNDFNEAMEFDAAGNIYLVGSSVSNPVQFGSISVPTQGSFDIYVAKVDAASGDFLWVRMIGGTDTDTPVGAAVSPAGDVYVTGHLRGTVDFDPSPSGTFLLTAASGPGTADAFVSKLDANGNFAWARQFSSPYDEFGHRVALDNLGHVYAVGTFRNTTDFGEPGDPLLVTSTTPDVAAIFVAKLEASSGATLWADQIGGSGPVTAARVAADANGNVYLAGRFEESVNFDGGAVTLDSPGGQDGFLSRWDAEGNVVWIGHLASGPGSVGGAALQLDPAGDLLLTYEFSGTVDFDPGTGTTILTSVDAASDAAVVKISADGSFGWVRHIAGPGATQAHRAVQDVAGNVYVGGSFQASASLPTGHVLTQLGDGQFIMKLAFGDAPTKFYVVDDASANRTFEYDAGGGAHGNNALNSGNAAPRGAASTAVGDKVWVVDANRKVYVYDINGNLLGSWSAGSMASNATPEGIATNGTDIWIVDGKSDKVYRFSGAASRLSGSQNATGSFNLNSGNSNPKDIVTDGASFWVVNDSSTDKVFKYALTGSLLGSWTISSANASPTGITIDPTNASDIWIVDNGTDRVYQYAGAASRTSGSQGAVGTFALANGNTNPQGIADPPPSAAQQRSDIRAPTSVIPHAPQVASDNLSSEKLLSRRNDIARTKSNGTLIARHQAFQNLAAERQFIAWIGESLDRDTADVGFERGKSSPDDDRESKEDAFDAFFGQFTPVFESRGGHC